MKPFKLIEEVPQLGFVVIAAILLGDLAVVGSRIGSNSPGNSETSEPAPVVSTSAGPAEQDTFGSAETGPEPGVAAAAYVAMRKAELARRVAAEPTAKAAAVVSFSSNQTPAQVVTLLKGLPVTSVLVHVYLKRQTTDAGVLTTKGDLAPALSAGLDRVVASLTADADANENQGKTVSHLEIKENADQQQAFYTEASVERQEIAVLKADGPTLYAAVVTGTYTQLGALGANTSVRLVDPADDGVTAAQVVPHGLLPNDTKYVETLYQLEGLGKP